MKVTLIDPPTVLSKTRPTVLPLGLLYIGAVLLKHGIDTSLIEGDGVLSEDFKRETERIDGGLVGIYCSTPSFNSAIDITKHLKEKNKDALIVLGGPHASLTDVETLKYCSDVDVVVRNEGEYSVLELIQSLIVGDSFDNIKGITYRKGKRVIRNPDRPFITDLDELPFPARSLITLQENSNYPNYLLGYMITSRGCPYNCIYCASPSFWNRTVRFRSPSNVVDEMVHLIDTYNVRYISFWDDTFTLNHERVKQICEEITRRKLDVMWFCTTRVDLVTKPLLKKMHAAGCHTIQYGVESGNQEILNTLQKGITIEQIHNAFRWTKKIGIKINAQFMIGNPGENRATVQDTIKLAKELKPDTFHVNITTPYPGTELYRIADKRNWIKTKDWSAYFHFGRGVMELDTLQRDQLRKLFGQAILEIYAAITE